MGAAYSAGATVCTYRGEPVMCGPRGLRGAPDHLFRNNGDGTFTDTSRQAGVADEKGLYGFGVAWLDLDDDGRLDLLVANDSGPNYVYRNRGDGRFDDISYPSGAALDGNGREQAHMGVAIGDYDNDGRNDIHITNFADDFNVLYHNHDGATFTDVSFRIGRRAGRRFRSSAGARTFSTTTTTAGSTCSSSTATSIRRRTRCRGTRRTRSARCCSATWRARGSKRSARPPARADDAARLARVGRRRPRQRRRHRRRHQQPRRRADVARNAGGGAAGHWLKVRLIGDPAQKSPRDAIGSVVFVTAGGVRRRGEVASGRGQISQSDLRVHFGLGSGDRGVEA